MSYKEQADGYGMPKDIKPELVKALYEFLDSLQFGKCKSYLKVSRKAYEKLLTDMNKIGV